MNSATFMFCKRCGAVTKPGVCSYCGYDNDLWERKQNGLEPDAEEDLNASADVYSEACDETGDLETANAEGQAEAILEETLGDKEGLPEYEVEEAVYLSPEQTKLDEDKKKKKTAPWAYILGIGIPVCSILLCLIIVTGIMMIPFIKGMQKASNLNNNNNNIASNVTSEEEEESEEKEESSKKDAVTEEELTDNGQDVGLYGERKIARKNLGDSFRIEDYLDDGAKYSDEANSADDYYLQKGYISSFGTDHTNRSRDSFYPPYILDFGDSIDTEVSYELVRHYETYEGKVKGIDVSSKISYYEIVSDEIPNLDELNKKIKEATCNEFYNYLKTGSGYGAYRNVEFYTDSFITYNDEDKLSILLDIDIRVDYDYYSGYGYYYDSQESYIYAINADLIDGEIIDNNRIVEVDEDFAKAFRKQCCDQNGYDIDALNNMSNKTVAKYLSSPESSIYFLTPLGLEVGYLYRASTSNGKSTGWMTITLTDYFDLLTDDYRDLFEGTKKRPEPITEDDSEDASSEKDASDKEEPSE